MKTNVTVTCHPTRAIVTLGCVGASVTIDILDSLDHVVPYVERTTSTTPAERGALRRWVRDPVREVGDWWNLTDVDGDDVASVVLV